MNSYGLSSEELFQTGFLEYKSLVDSFLEKILTNSELFNDVEIFSSILGTAKHEALLRTFAMMISNNNDVFVKQLTEAGILPGKE